MKITVWAETLADNSRAEKTVDIDIDSKDKWWIDYKIREAAENGLSEIMGWGFDADRQESMPIDPESVISVSREKDNVSVALAVGGHVLHKRLDLPTAKELSVAIQTAASEPRHEDEVYCPQCSACGEDGCCPATSCHLVQCAYGESYFRGLAIEKEYHEALHDSVVALGFEAPCYLTPQLAKLIGSKVVGGRTIAEWIADEMPVYDI